MTTLRGGKGALYVKAAGNGFGDIGGSAARCGGAIALGVSCENANFDPENTVPYQIVVGAVNADGVKASYSTTGSAIWVSAPGGEFGRNVSVSPGFGAEVYEPAMVTTDQSGCTVGYSRTGVNTSLFNNGSAQNLNCRYTNTMNGTSSATPVTVGVIALILEANPALTWRDVKHILAKTARQIDAGRAGGDHRTRWRHLRGGAGVDDERGGIQLPQLVRLRHGRRFGGREGGDDLHARPAGHIRRHRVDLQPLC